MNQEAQNPSSRLAQELAHLDSKIKTLDKTLKDLKKERARVEAEAKEQFVSEGVSSIKLATGETAYMRRQIYASKATGVASDFFAQRLIDAGLKEFVKRECNSQQLSAWLREREREKDEPVTDDWDNLLPDEIKGLVSVHEKVTINVLGTGKKS